LPGGDGAAGLFFSPIELNEDAMRSTTHQFDYVHFSLVCIHCDAGMGVESEDQAVADGWTDIDYAPGLPMANFVGLCPDCREAFERWPNDGDDNDL
jgi:hypothetical protein